MAAISLFWYTNMAAVTSDENDLLILLLTLALSFLTVMPEILTLVLGSLSLIQWPRFKISAATTSADFESSLMSLVPTCTIKAVFHFKRTVP
jgi:hypothetical protein